MWRRSWWDYLVITATSRCVFSIFSAIVSSNHNLNGDNCFVTRQKVYFYVSFAHSTRLCFFSHLAAHQFHIKFVLFTLPILWWTLSRHQVDFSTSTRFQGVDVKNACFGGTQAVFHAIDWVHANYSTEKRHAIAVLADIAVYERGPARPTGGRYEWNHFPELSFLSGYLLEVWWKRLTV